MSHTITIINSYSWSDGINHHDRRFIVYPEVVYILTMARRRHSDNTVNLLSYARQEDGISLSAFGHEGYEPTGINIARNPQGNFVKTVLMDDEEYDQCLSDVETCIATLLL